MKSIWHPWIEWECYHAGMFDAPLTVPIEEAKRLYASFLGNVPRFHRGMMRVVTEWPKSCEHFLTKQGMNRLAWLGQAAVCISIGLPRTCRGGFNQLSIEEKVAANDAAQLVLDEWIDEYGKESASIHCNVEGTRVSRRHS